MKEKDKKRELYCNLEYFMKHGCRGCKLGRKCDEWDRDRVKRNRSDCDNRDTDISDNKELKELSNNEIQDKW